VRYGDGDAVGLEARFLLAQRLSEEGQAGYFLEAESHLLRLARRRDVSRVVASRATEALARLCLRKGLLDDAAFCCQKLAHDFATVRIRDGRTGTDLAQNLATDKRLLPFLEASRFERASEPLRAVEAKGSFPAKASYYFFEPEGELLPFFHRYRLGLDLNNGQLKWIDQATGVERWALNVGLTKLLPFLNGAADQNVTVRYGVIG